MDKLSTRLQKYFNDLINESDIVIEEVTLSKLNKIAKEWENFTQGRTVDTEVVSKLIYESWVRSRDYGVDPYIDDRESLSLSEEEVRKQLPDSKKLISQFGNVVISLQRMAIKHGSIIQLFDKNAKSIQLLAVSNNLNRALDMDGEFLIPDNASESHIGTNAVCIALRENKSVQVSGPQHYNKFLHNKFCSAAPIHNSKGEIIGALNITSQNRNVNKLDTLFLVAFLARILDNISFTTDTLGVLDRYDSTINSAIEYFPQGIVYFSDNYEIKRYNEKIVEMLGIVNDDPDAELKRCISFLLNQSEDGTVDDLEVALDINGNKKNFLMTKKKVYKKNDIEENILILQNVKYENSNLQGNEAIYTFDDIIGNNETMIAAKRLARKVSRSNSSILIFGESGTGKELFAQAIHNASKRKKRPFVAINCGAIPYELVESELFGYEPGAFTGAARGGKIGKMEMAMGGTLFLDEIESMPLNIQVKLLRALSTNKICRVGGVKEIPIDVRLISATKKDLLQEADDGNFREDLYYRLSILTISLSPLRERKDDISVIAKYYIKKISHDLGLKEIKVENDFYEALTQYYWRGNVRELRNIIERAIILLDEEGVLTSSHLPEKILKAYNYKRLRNKLAVIKNNKNDNLMKLGEEIIIETVLNEENGNLSRTAYRLGISRPTLCSKIANNEKLKNKMRKLKFNEKISEKINERRINVRK